jgi:hypothetical protein
MYVCILAKQVPQREYARDAGTSTEEHRETGTEDHTFLDSRWCALAITVCPLLDNHFQLCQCLHMIFCPPASPGPSCTLVAILCALPMSSFQLYLSNLTLGAKERLARLDAAGGAL